MEYSSYHVNVPTMEGDYSRFTPSGRIAEICGDGT